MLEIKSSLFTHSAYPKKLKALFLAKLFRDYGYLIGFFFYPLFLFQFGSLLPLTGLSEFQKGMVVVGVYFLVERIGVLVLTLPLSRLIQKIQARNAMILGIFLHIITLGLLTQAENYPVLILFVILIEMIRIPLYWISYYTLFSAFAVYKRMGESVGTIEFFSKMAQASAPSIAGLLIVGFGHSYAFLSALSLQVIALSMLLFIDVETTVSKPSVSQFWSWSKERGYRRMAFSYAGKSVIDLLYSLWPFFVFFIIGNVDQVGILYSVVYFVSLLIVYFTGWYIDHSKSRLPFSVSGVLMGSIWIFRSFLQNPFSIIAVDAVDRVLSSFYLPYYESLLLRRAKGRNAFSYFVYRELIISMVGILFWVLFICYFLIFDSWQSFLLLGFVGMLASLQLSEHKKLE